MQLCNSEEFVFPSQASALQEVLRLEKKVRKEIVQAHKDTVNVHGPPCPRSCLAHYSGACRWRRLEKSLQFGIPICVLTVLPRHVKISNSSIIKTSARFEPRN